MLESYPAADEKNWNGRIRCGNLNLDSWSCLQSNLQQEQLTLSDKKFRTGNNKFQYFALKSVMNFMNLCCRDSGPDCAAFNYIRTFIYL